MQIVLASQSPYRRAQLEQFGLRFQFERPAIDEDALKLEGPRDLTELTRFLALRKALSLRDKYPSALIIGSDQLVECEGRRLDKPGSKENAVKQMKMLSNKSHRLLTSIALVHKDQELIYTDRTTLWLRDLEDELIESYLDKDEPFDCAGSYKIERAGMALIAKMETEDPSAIQGLPLLSLVRGIEALGLSLPNLWSTP